MSTNPVNIITLNGVDLSIGGSSSGGGLVNASCFYANPRWLRFNSSNKKGLKILGGTSIRLNNGDYYTFENDTDVDLSSYISSVGTDYYVYMNTSGTVSAYPTTQTVSDQIKIGRFHTLCANAGTMTMTAPASGMTTADKYLVKSYKALYDKDFYDFYNKQITAVTSQSQYDVVTMSHPLSGFLAGEILPESVFCLSWYPDTLYDDAMVYDKDTDIVVDVYLQSGKGFGTRSKYNQTHTVSRQPYNHQEDMRMVGKKLLNDYQFTSIALGSNERTNITGSSDKTTVGGHVDTSNRRMISAIGCEECCGYLWQWLDEIGPVGGSGWSSTDGHGSFGQEYGTPYVVRAGGGWGSGSSCGSRSRASDDGRSYVATNNGGRGSSRVVKNIF